MGEFIAVAGGITNLILYYIVLVISVILYEKINNLAEDSQKLKSEEKEEKPS